MKKKWAVSTLAAPTLKMNKSTQVLRYSQCRLEPEPKKATTTAALSDVDIQHFPALKNQTDGVFDQWEKGWSVNRKQNIKAAQLPLTDGLQKGYIERVGMGGAVGGASIPCLHPLNIHSLQMTSLTQDEGTHFSRIRILFCSEERSVDI